ncbi:MAG: autotransporter domain-containing protein [Candidatus Omnitrophica bacterium]|nr:autotransporter domain-containing protein [Candidatus Omnitrophota bacterium]
MKSLLLGFMVLSIALLAPAIAMASPMGGEVDIATPRGEGLLELGKTEYGMLKVGFNADIVTEREMDGGPDFTGAELSGEWYSGTISYTLADRFEPYVRLGAAAIDLEWIETNVKREAEGDMGFAWEVGAKLFIWEWEDTGLRFSTQGSYRSYDGDYDQITMADTIFTDITNATYDVEEWQVGLLVSREFDMADQVSIVPYVGVKYSDCFVDSRLTVGSAIIGPGPISSDDTVGVTVGADLLIEENLAVTIEGRFVDETAVSTGCTLLF